MIAETPNHEPVIALGRDRLVLRQADHQFWAAVTCPSCAVDTASVDFSAHRQVCRRTVAVVRTASERVPGPGTDADVPSRPGRQGRLQNPSSARVFGQRRATPVGDLLVLAMAIVAAVVVVVVILRSSP